MQGLVEASTKLHAGYSANQVLAELALATQSKQLDLLRTVNREVGCKAADLLILLQQHDRFLSQVRDRVRLAVGAAKFNNRIMLTSPWFAVLLCQWLGLNSLGLILTTLWGYLILATSAMLCYLASARFKELVSAIDTAPADPGFKFDLAAVVRASGYRNAQNLLTVKPASVAGFKAQAFAARAELANSIENQLAKLPEKLMLNSALLLLPAAVLLSVGPAIVSGLSALAGPIVT